MPRTPVGYAALRRRHDVELAEEIRKRNVRGALVDDEAHRAVFRVRAHVDHRAREARVGHDRHGKQELAVEVAFSARAARGARHLHGVKTNASAARVKRPIAAENLLLPHAAATLAANVGNFSSSRDLPATRETLQRLPNPGRYRQISHTMKHVHLVGVPAAGLLGAAGRRGDGPRFRLGRGPQLARPPHRRQRHGGRRGADARGLEDVLAHPRRCRRRAAVVRLVEIGEPRVRDRALSGAETLLRSRRRHRRLQGHRCISRAADGEGPGKPIDLRLSLEYGVCKEICIPAEAALSLECPPDTEARCPTSLPRH